MEPLKSSKVGLKPLKNSKDEQDDAEYEKRTQKLANKVIVPTKQVGPIIKPTNEKYFSTLPTPNFNQTKENKFSKDIKFKTLKFKKSGKKILLTKPKLREENNEKRVEPQEVPKELLSPEKPTASSDKSIIRKPSSHMRNRYNEQVHTGEPGTSKFTGFGDDEIIINPEFNKSLKESLKQSKRRLMLFIDNNESKNPVVDRPKFSVIPIKDESSKISNKAKKNKEVIDH